PLIGTGGSGAGGGGVGFLGVGLDLSAHKLAEEALKASTKKFDDIQLALDRSAIVAIYDGEGRITYANDKLCDITKYPREEILGQNPRIFKSGHHTTEFFRELWDTVLAGKAWPGEICNKAKGGPPSVVATTT